MKKLFLILILTLCFSGCGDNSLTPFAQYTGKWHFTFSSESSVYGNTNIIVLDNGTFCGTFTAVSPAETFSFEGVVSNEGNVTGKFSSSCGVSLRGTVTGSLLDAGGIGSGQGTWTDSTRSFITNCTWSGRRN